MKDIFEAAHMKIERNKRQDGKKRSQREKWMKNSKGIEKKRFSRHLIGISEDETSNNGTEKIFQGIIQGNYSEIKEDLNVQFERTYSMLGKIHVDPPTEQSIASYWIQKINKENLGIQIKISGQLYEKNNQAGLKLFHINIPF